MTFQDLISKLTGPIEEAEARAHAERLAKKWVVHAYEKLVADLENSDDVPSAFELSFIDGYLTGNLHASENLLTIVKAQAVALDAFQTARICAGPEDEWAYISNHESAHRELDALARRLEGGMKGINTGAIVCLMNIAQNAPTKNASKSRGTCE